MITKAIERAYRTARERNWDSVYWAIDLHGVCFPTNYTKHEYKMVNYETWLGLLTISHRPESKIILWSSAHDDEVANIIEYFAARDIKIDYFNSNPEIKNTHTGNFEKKFYFSILLDDKAGFDPTTDWQIIIDYFKAHPEPL